MVLMSNVHMDLKMYCIFVTLSTNVVICLNISRKINLMIHYPVHFTLH